MKKKKKKRKEENDKKKKKRKQEEKKKRIFYILYHLMWHYTSPTIPSANEKTKEGRAAIMNISGRHQSEQACMLSSVKISSE